MKKIYLLTLAAIIGLNAMAQQKSNVVVFSEDGETFFAFLNGVKQNATAQSNVKIVDVPGQSASLRLVFANSSDQPIKQDLHFLEPNQEHTIKVKRDKKGVLKMRYFGATALNESTSTASPITYTATEVPANNNTVTTNTTGTTNTTATPNTTGTSENVNMNMQVNDPNNTSSSQTVTTTTTTTTNTTGTTNNNGGNGSGSINMNVNENGFNMNVSVSGTENGENGNGSINMNMSGMETESSETVTSSSTTTTTTTTSSSSSSGYNSSSSSTTTTSGNGGYTTTGGTTGYTTTSSSSCVYAIDEVAFSKMKGAIANNAFDDTKMSTAKTATKGSCLSTDQVRQVMMLFNMDDDRLDYAKYAYDYTVDKNNFYLLGDAFVFDGNKDDLNKFIETKR